MTVDLSNLKLVEEVIEVADDASYVDAQQFAPPVPEGIYTFIQGKPEFTATAGGYLQAKMDHVITGGEHDGAKVTFDRVSDKPFERSGVKVSMAADHVRALYGPAERPACKSHADYAAAIEQGEGRTFKAEVQWEAGCNHADTPQAVEWGDQAVVRVRGERSFPQNGAGVRSAELPCKTCGQTMIARSRINRRIAAS